MSGITRKQNKIVKVSHYIKAEFGREGIRIFSVIKPPDGSVHLFDYELALIVDEYRKYKDSQT